MSLYVVVHAVAHPLRTLDLVVGVPCRRPVKLASLIYVEDFIIIIVVFVIGPSTMVDVIIGCFRSRGRRFEQELFVGTTARWRY